MNYDVLIVGAGSAGVGIAALLKDIGIENLLVVDKGEVGSSFRRWPAEMRFITPSFTSNFFAQMDLNSIAQGTSPAFTLRTEHPSGPQYAEYLGSVVDLNQLPVETGVTVKRIEKEADDFFVHTSSGIISARFVIWAGGEFSFPRRSGFPGSDLCQHNTSIGTYVELEGDEYWIIGGYESGIDAAINLSRLGKVAHVIDPNQKWSEFSTDPSVNLSTYTHERLTEALTTRKIRLHGGRKVTKIELVDGKYTIHTDRGEQFLSETRPIAATGFEVSDVIEDHFEVGADGLSLNEWDESTRLDNLFLVGPQVRQKGLIFCFIYKFRQRFGVVAKEIGERLGFDMTGIEALSQDGLYLDDLSCCGKECAC